RPHKCGGCVLCCRHLEKHQGGCRVCPTGDQFGSGLQKNGSPCGGMQAMMFLQKVAEEKRTLVKGKKENTSFETLMKKAMTQRKRPFYDVFKKRHQKDVKIIAEVKRASPSRGILRKNINVPE